MLGRITPMTSRLLSRAEVRARADPNLSPVRVFQLLTQLAADGTMVGNLNMRTRDLEPVQ